MSQQSSAVLQDQQVAVVGGTSGMGLGIARAALDAGAAVVIAGRRPVAPRAGSARRPTSPAPRCS
jgi:NAD(P)-dependent dehydrogenase (short-subunit alcohol dehydrogenase family)